VDTTPRSRDGSVHVTDERFNTVSHIVGLCFALVGAGLLISQSSVEGDPWKIVGLSIYGTPSSCCSRPACCTTVWTAALA